MKKNKGFTLIELLAVIIVLGIIALIAIPSVTGIIRDARIKAWQTTADQMVKAAGNYYRLAQIDNDDYITDFKSAASSAGPGKYFDEYGSSTANEPLKVQFDTQMNIVYNMMIDSLSLKGNIPTYNQIKKFTINEDGKVTLAFDNKYVYCMTVQNDKKFTKEEYDFSLANPTSADWRNKMKAGGNAICIRR